ncbi:calcium-dependent phosphotriesterase [Neoconidiobolus thromboides FSU 785]|nr:calcium-dependent phosphotriesterase [Neoconidiobolus thromboides FSU 785]
MGLKFNIASTFLAIIAYFLFDVVRIIYRESLFKGYNQSEFDNCDRVKEIKGCADITVHGASGFAFVGCPEDYYYYKNFISFLYNPRDKIVLGKRSFIYAYDLKNKEAKKLQLKSFPENVDFFTHGSDVITDPKDKNKIHFLTVNHREGGKDTVEHFVHKIGTDSITWIESFEDDKLKLVSNIAAVTPTSFYYTQDLSHVNGLMNYMESLGLIEGGKIMFKDEANNYSEIQNGFKLTNGIALSPNKKNLYLAESFRGKIHIFDRNPKTNKLSKKDSVVVNFSPIGLKSDPLTGQVYIAGIPIDLSIIDSWGSFGDYRSKLTKSIVAKLSNATSSGDKYKVDTVIIDDGGNLSSTTSAASDGTTGSLLMTGIFNYKGLLNCRV